MLGALKRKVILRPQTAPKTCWFAALRKFD